MDQQNDHSRIHIKYITGVLEHHRSRLPSPFSVLHRGHTEISGGNGLYQQNEKRMKKSVDKRRSVWYSNKAVAEVSAPAGTAEKKLKDLEKSG